MKLNAVFIFLLVALSAGAQTVATTANVLHPLMKNQQDPKHPHALSSVDRDPNESADLQAPTSRAYAPAAQSGAAAKPAVIIARIDPNLIASPISMIGTISGIKGRLYVTNIGAQTIIPFVQLAVCDRKGFKIASTSKTGLALAPNEGERIDVVATNADAADLKLMKLSAGSGKK